MGRLEFLDHQNIFFSGSNGVVLGYEMHGSWGGPAWVGEPSVLPGFRKTVAGLGFPCKQVSPNHSACSFVYQAS